MTEPGDGRGDLSIGRLAVYAMVAATAVLVLATAIILVIKPGPVLGLIVGLLGVAGAIAAMGFVSKRMTRNAYGPDPEDPEPGSDR
ncbi:MULTISPECIES: membrane protein [unclassified Rhodococcus (in: high G+C Gram-positive bacteria)]|uniref:membrane protein n=1 Tax=unclassified Rhodococcus (in: high G+C Gram-positive bacteria) TaxID=192944 RepID=UPI0002ECF9E4|nr:membrane protein [Rhodococcus sp. DK17]